jgi:hypothetical protein
VSTIEVTNTYRDGISYQCSIGEFKNTVNGDRVAISSSGEFQDVVREGFDVVRRSADPAVDYRLDVAYDDYPYEISWSLQSLTTGAVAAASCFKEVAELDYVLLQSVGLAPGSPSLLPTAIRLRSLANLRHFMAPPVGSYLPQ